MFIARSLLPCVLLSLSLLIHPALSQAETVRLNGVSYDIGDAPSWVADRELPRTTVASHYGQRVLLRDTQYNWLGPRSVRYKRQVVEVTAGSGIENAAKYQIEFDPNYQTLTLHRLRIKRNGVWSSRLSGKVVELLRRESNLESNQYDGRITASLNVPDVRVGDQVELAYSVEGQNPIFDGRPAARVYLVDSYPVGDIHMRILAPASLRLKYGIVGDSKAKVTERLEGGTRILEAEHQQVAPLLPEDRVPTTAIQYPYLHVSTYHSWPEVAAWGRGLFETAEPTSDEFRQKVAELRKIRKVQDRVTAALNFVQDDVRYFGVEINVNSHKPYPPDQVIGQRYGDCKDKTLLLYWLLKASGIESTPALASFEEGGMLDRALPSPEMFDHVILRYQDGGKTWWLDGTINGQGDDLATLGHFDYGYVLPLDTAGKGLVQAEPPFSVPATAVMNERFSVPDLSGYGDLVIEGRFTREEAERVRRKFQYSGKEELQQQWHDLVRQTYPGAELVEPLQTNDDLRANVLTTREHYRVNDVFTYAEGAIKFQIQGGQLASYLVVPEKTARRMPIDLPTRLAVTYEYELVSPLISRKDGKPVVVDDPHLNFVSTRSTLDGRLKIRMQLDMRKPEVAPAQVDSYLKAVQAVRGETSLSYTNYILDTTQVAAEIEPKLRERHASLQPAYWKESLIKNTIRRTAWQRLLDRYHPSPTIRAAIASYLGWSDIDLGEPQTAEKRLALMGEQPEQTADGKGLSAIVNLYLNRPELGWRYFKESQEGTDKEPEWYMARIGALSALMLGHYDDSRRLVSTFLADTDESVRQDAARWLAVTLRLQYGPTPEAERNWPDGQYKLDADRVAETLLHQPNRQLERFSELYQGIEPEGAARMWFALALDARKAGDSARAEQNLRRILDLKIGLLPEYGMAAGITAGR